MLQSFKVLGGGRRTGGGGGVEGAEERREGSVEVKWGWGVSRTWKDRQYESRTLLAARKVKQRLVAR